MQAQVSRRRVIQLFGLAAAVPAVASLAACTTGGATTATAAAAKGAGKLTYVYIGNASQEAAQKAQFAGFLKANPKISLTAQAIPATNWATFSDAIATRIAGGSAPDVIDIATEGLGLFRSKKLVTPLDPYIAKNKAAIDEYYADMDPTYKKISDRYGNPGSTTFFMPGGFNTVCLWANTSLFHRAGVDLPGGEDWTWDDYEKAAAKIKAKTGAYMATGSTAQFNGIMPWLLTNGASTLNADWTKPVIDSDAAVEAAEFCAMMVAKGYFTQPGGTADEPSLLSQDKLATVQAGRWVLQEFQTLKAIDKIEIIKFPKKKQNGSPIGWDAFPILSSSQNKNASWDFVEFITTKSNAINFAKNGGTNIPARKSVALSNAFLDNAPKGSNLLYEAASYATAVPSPNRGDLTQTAVESAWLQIISGQVAASTGLKQLSEKLSTLL